MNRGMVKVNEGGGVKGQPSSLVSNEDESFVILGRSPPVSQPPSMGFSSNMTMINHPNGQSLAFMSSTSDFNPEEIELKLNSLLQENYKLKETLQQNNLAMKQQFATLVTWQEQVAKVHETHKAKFAETKELVLKLRAENKELKDIIEELKQNDTTKTAGPAELQLRAENKELKDLIEKLRQNDSAKTAGPAELQLKIKNKQLEATVEDLQKKLLHTQANDSASSKKEQELCSLLEQVNRRLETAERARRQQDIEIERLVAQKSKLDQEIGTLKTDIATYRENMLTSEQEKKILQAKIQELQIENSRLSLAASTMGERQSQAQQDISDSQRFKELEEKYYKLYSDYETLQQELLTYQKDQQVKETHNNAYFEVQARGFTEKISELKKAVAEKDEAILQRDKQLVKMKDALKKLALENDEIPILKAQVEVYQSDFNAEREARERLVGEKEKLAEDLRSLQRQNQQLQDEMEVYQANHFQQQQQQQQQVVNTQNSSGGWYTIAAPGRNHTPRRPSEPERHEENNEIQLPPEDDIPPPQKYYCPKCEMVFKKIDLLQYHVETCLELS